MSWREICLYQTAKTIVCVWKAVCFKNPEPYYASKQATMLHAALISTHNKALILIHNEALILIHNKALHFDT